MVTLKQATDDLVKAKMEPYVMALGKVAHAWNYLQEALGQLFCAVTGLENDNTGQAIWHSVANDPSAARHAACGNQRYGRQTAQF